ncbi:MAG: hypothetical protein ABIQ51_19375 [Mesorhizobium sp.]
MNRHASIGFLAVQLLAATLSFAAFADEATMKGADILTTLKGARVEGSDWAQSFDDGGATLYIKGSNQSQGRWDVRGDEYCSLWPPSDVWACYAMTIDSSNPANEQVTWISADGARSTAHLIRKGQ